MHTLRLNLKVILAATALASIALVSIGGCGKETVLSTPPAVVSTIPVNGAIGVPVTQVVSATFSVAMNPATISNASFTVATGGTAIAGTVSYSTAGSVASFTPTVSLAYNTLYTATITTAVTDTLGDEPSASYIWSFTTGVRPTVIATLPANGATGVPLTQVLSATFSKAMNCATLASPAPVPQLWQARLRVRAQ